MSLVLQIRYPHQMRGIEDKDMFKLVGVDNGHPSFMRLCRVSGIAQNTEQACCLRCVLDDWVPAAEEMDHGSHVEFNL